MSGKPHLKAKVSGKVCCRKRSRNRLTVAANRRDQKRKNIGVLGGRERLDILAS